VKTAFSTNVNWKEGTLIAFNSSTGLDGVGCIVELRFNRQFTINTDSLWKCSSSAPGNWFTVGFDDSSFTPNVVTGDNSRAIDLQNFARTQGFRHLPNIRESSKRIWGSQTNSPTFCRLTLDCTILHSSHHF
jgi:hypothetical protein